MTKDEALALVHLLDRKIVAWSDPTSRKPCCLGAPVAPHAEGRRQRPVRLVFACGNDWRAAAQEYYRAQEMQPEKWPEPLRGNHASGSSLSENSPPRG